MGANVFTGIESKLAKLYDDMATAYFKLTKYDDAGAMYQKGLDIKLEVYGQNHPWTIQSYSNIGTSYFHQFQYELALASYEKAIKSQWYTIGPKDSNIKTGLSIATISNKIKDDHLTASILQNISEIFQQLQQSLN